ncbi:MAG: bifunctional diaminohydroxyphosphoribosylaminopyrimidine deaminase/5-amino-6-(5-phosphoribosylamino)uracil reductase RibD, partial [Bacteroidota bacterium]
NPLVGAVLLHDDRIIAEGWHRQYGGPHAEVNCIDRAMQDGLGDLIPHSILYVSLEPCAHFGKTPPCTDLILKHKIPEVVIGCRDPFNEVDGKGIEKLKASGVRVESGVLEDECKEMNKRFFTFHTQHRPYVILKWAQTKDGFIAPPPPAGGILASDSSIDNQNFEDAETPPAEGLGEARLFISNEYSNRLVHQWRSEEAAILVGTNTALLDDPELTTRLWPGHSPVRVVVDMDLKLPESLKVFNQQAPTIMFNTKFHSEQMEWPPPFPFKERVGVRYYQVTHDVSLVHQMMNALYQLRIQSVLVEGGARLLQSFIDEGIWDEARVIENTKLKIGNGLPAPVLPETLITKAKILLADVLTIFKRPGY